MHLTQHLGFPVPAINPRITITLQPSVHAVLRRLSELTGNSQSAIVGELLAESLPTFERMAQVLAAAEALRTQGMKVPEEVAKGLDHAQARIEAQLGLALDDMDTSFRPLVAEAESIARRAGRTAGRRPASAGASAQGTPPSNRGVRLTQNTGKRRAKKGQGGRP